MHRRAHRANLLAGRILAVLASHRLKVRPRRGQIALEVSIDAQPLHIAPDAHLLLAYHSDIIFRITADNARVAARATVHVDRHSPRVFLVLPVREERVALVRRRVRLRPRWQIQDWPCTPPASRSE